MSYLPGQQKASTSSIASSAQGICCLNQNFQAQAKNKYSIKAYSSKYYNSLISSYQQVVNFNNKLYLEPMIKYNTSRHLEPSLYSNYKIKQPGAHLAQLRTQIIDENNTLERLNVIRRKYTSKQKERSVLGTRKQDHSKNKDPQRQVLKEKFNERTRSQFHIGNYTYHSSQLQSFKKHTTSNIHFEQMKERHERSKQKVCERVQNIRKINDKIKNILNRFEISTETSLKNNLEKRQSVIQQRRQANSSLKSRKMQIIGHESNSKQLSRLQNSIQYKKQEQIKKAEQLNSQFQASLKSQLFPLKPFHTITVHVSHNQSLNMTIDESFVLQKYNPTQAKSEQNEMLRLVSKICAQIEYDEQFRTSKYFFLLNLREDKYQRLQQQFQIKGVFYSLDELTQLMRFAEEEYDPFMYETAHQDYSKYAASFIIANNHWLQNLHQKYDFHKLIKDGIQESLTVDNIDVGVVVADFVRFVNMTSGNLYKNRDLMVIMRRIGQGHIKLSNVYNTFCKNYQ